MRKSKLESYEAILEILVNNPLTIEDIAFETDMDCTVLNERLDFLLENGLVELRPMGERGGYAMTERGVAVLKALNFQKYLTRIANKLSLIDEALQVISKHSEDLEKKTED
jgi:predicted transcriptional regulator